MKEQTEQTDRHARAAMARIVTDRTAMDAATDRDAVTDRSVRAVMASRNAEARAQETVRTEEATRAEDRSVRAKADLREETETMRLSLTEWKPSQTRRTQKNVIITKKKEINLLN